MDIETTCSKCGAALKLRATVAGRTIQCPRCGRKTEVARGGPVAAAAPASAAETRPAPAGPAPLPPVDADVVDEAPDAPASVRAESSPQSDGVPLQELQDRIRRMEAELDVARLRAEEAERARQQALESRSIDRKAVRQEAVQHQESELQAAKQCIAELQARLSAEYQKRISSPAGRSASEIEREVLQEGGAPVATPVEDEVADPDALIAEIKRSSFGRDLRSSVVIHAILIAVTSVGLLIAWLRGAPPATPASDTTGQPVATNAAAAVMGGGAASNAPASRPAERPSSREGTGTSSLERAVEALPEKGELPRESSVSLDGDL